MRPWTESRRLPAGTILHRTQMTPGNFATASMGIAYCGARAGDGAAFTAYSRKVTCKDCRRHIALRQAAARQRFSEVTR
jgi:hypothetical protein